MSINALIPGWRCGYDEYFHKAVALIKMIEQAKKNFAELPLEEQTRIKKEREEAKERRRVEAFVQQGRCPYCENRLKRGKKNKKNGYKRTWTCRQCERDICL